jgi:large subunit ribosomal protein L5
MAARLKEYYQKEAAPALMKKFSYKSVMQIPKLEKIVINVAAGDAKENSKVIDSVISDLSAITGQKPMICTAKSPSLTSKSALE